MRKNTLFFLMARSVVTGAVVLAGDGQEEENAVYKEPESYADT